MKIYSFDQFTKELIGEMLAEKDPLDGENWLIPRNSTAVQPPETSENEAAIFNDSGWDIVPDYRGEKYYTLDMKEVVIKELGETVPENMPRELPDLTVIGVEWSFVDGEWASTPIPVTRISPRQARLQLLVLGKFDQVEPAIESIPEPQKTQAKIEWEYATFYERTNPFIVQMGAVLAIDLDQFFIDADKI